MSLTDWPCYDYTIFVLLKKEMQSLGVTASGSFHQLFSRDIVRNSVCIFEMFLSVLRTNCSLSQVVCSSTKRP